MRYYGSLTNRIEERVKSATPEIGMGVTEMMYSDRVPYEVIAIKDARHITVRVLDAKRIDKNGMSECQEYEYKSNEQNACVNLFLTKQGVWREKYRDRSLGCNIFVIGYAEKYHDYSF